MHSFVNVPEDSHFPIQNLPYGIFSRGVVDTPRVGVAIGEMVLDLALLEDRGLFNSPYLRGRTIFKRPVLNFLMALGQPAWGEARATIQRLLSGEDPSLRDDTQLGDLALVPMDEVTMHLPAAIGDFTDFYSSREHATNVGTMFRGKEKALQPNWLHMPVAYHGRASSVVVSDTDILRPFGQTKPDISNHAGAALPVFGPSQEMDFELELGFFIGPGSELGRPIPIDRAAEHIFGLVLVNDWSARDIQRWEYRPLGPFLAKNLATSISPWVVPMEALASFRCPGPTQEPEPLPYLRVDGDWAYDIELDIRLQSGQMDKPVVIAHTNARYLYWNMLQQLAHHTITGCDMRQGDLLASGTISGPTSDSSGSMLELAWRGTRPVQLPNGEERSFLEDGDRVTISGWCQGNGYRIGFGVVEGRLLSAQQH